MTTYNVTSGQTISGLTLNSGDSAYAYSGGSATDIVVEDGSTLTMSSGGSASGTIISGGFEYVSSGGTATGAVVSGGTEVVDGGGTASFAVVSAHGTQAVYSGGSAIATELSGLEEVYPGGSVSGLVVSGGDAFVYSDGTSTDTVIRTGGDETLYGVASGTVVSSGGTLTVIPGGLASFTVVSRGGAIDIPSLVYSSGGLATIDGSDVLTVTEGGDSATFQLAGSYGGEHFQTSQDNVIGTLITLVEPPRTLTWAGALGGGFGDVANWDDLTNVLNPATSPPDPTDTAEFLTGGGTITGTGTAASLEFGGPVSWDVTSGASLSAATSVIVGQGGIGTLLVNGGASIDGLGASDEISGGLGQNASAQVSGAGSNWKSSGELIVGAQGAGALSVGNAASLSAAAGGSLPAMVLGASASGSGALTVTGTLSGATLLGQLNVGQAGAGTLTVMNQATVITGGSTLFPSQGVDVAQAVGGSGNIGVSGTRSLLSNLGAFLVGDSGVGDLSIEAGGTVLTSPGAVAGLAGMVIANTASASGSFVNVSGAGTSLNVTGTLIVGNAGAGELSIAQGATVTATSLTIGGATGGDGGVSVAGTGSELTLTGVLNIGGLAPGGLSIENAGEVTAGSVTIGAGAGGAGNLVIGAGSTLTVTGTTAPVVVGTGTAAALLNIQGGTLVLSGSPTFGVNGRLVQVGGKIDPAPTLIVAGAAFSGGAVDEASVEVLNTATSVSKAPDIGGSGGAIFLAPLVTGGSASKPGIWNIDTGGTLVLDVNAVVATQVFTFADNTGVLEIGQQITLDGSQTPVTINAAAIGGFAGSIDGYVTGDRIVVDTTAAAGFSYVNGGTTITVNDLVAGVPIGAQEGTLAFTDAGAAAQAFADYQANATTALVDQPLACFAAGTRIETEDGPVAVETLRVGDEVRTLLGGPGRIGWIGTRTVNCARHPKPEKVWPIRVCRNAFGPGLPKRDLYLSPDHAVFVNDVLIPVHLLVNGTTIRQIGRASVTYYHVELDQHDVMLAEGLPAESYLDTRDRENFANGGGAVSLYPEFGAGRQPGENARVWEMAGCAPLVVTGEKLAAARADIAEWETSGEEVSGERSFG